MPVANRLTRYLVLVPVHGSRFAVEGAWYNASFGGDKASTHVANPELHAEVQGPRKTFCKTYSCQRRQLRSGRLNNGQPLICSCLCGLIRGRKTQARGEARPALNRQIPTGLAARFPCPSGSAG